ncbi:B-box zinc finger protein 21 [Euphorbia lathyris]|uniref:B-box zinc finger protein 21 n=1 Tax=Euphorbia lathyris TaxID=212925 RepID=UPI003313526C
MKLQCDVCSKDEASVYCTADEAALCDACDHRVHHANKLASKHQRFSLLHPSSKDFPLCDICQEKRAFLFCQQDRAILCRDCDGPIHKVNEHTLKHNRFLLTGVKLSPTSAIYSSSSSSSSCKAGDSVPDLKSQQSNKKGVSISTAPNSNLDSNSAVKPLVVSSDTGMNNKGGDYNLVLSEGVDLGSSTISEYLMETLPGWRVEDFLDFPSTPFGFYKVDEEISPLFGTDLINPLSSENMGLWVPQAPTAVNPSFQMVAPVLLKETKENTNMKNNSRRWTDDAFTVPQMNPSSGSKRVRSYW